MGSAQTKTSMNSPPRKSNNMENGYARGGRYVEARRSTGQRLLREESRRPRPELRNARAGNRGSNTSSIGDQQEKLAKANRGNGGSSNISRRMEPLKLAGEDEMVDGWPKWLTDNIPSDALSGIVPRSADSFDKLDKVGEGTYSNVYKARDRNTGKVVALKKVRFDTSEPESVKFMAREIMILQKLDHPNVLKLEGIAISRMLYSLYLVFDYMHSDLARIISRPYQTLNEPQVKCYMQQLLSGLQHCHERGILHRDIKGSNLLIDKSGMLKIGDFGLANYFDPMRKRHLTSRVVTLWYRAPELLLGASEYGVGIDLWSAGCLMAEMFTGRPILPGRTEVEQLHKIFKLCGTPSDEYWKRVKVSKTFRPPHAYEPSFREAFRNFPPSSLGLLKVLLALDPARRGSAGSALQNKFFHTSPMACDLSGLPVIQKEEDEPKKPEERRRHRSSKLRHRSPMQERRKKEPPEEKPKGHSGSSKEEPERYIDQGSSTSISSSIYKQSQQGRSPPSVTLDEPPKLKMSSSSEALLGPTESTQDLPPLTISKQRTKRYENWEDLDRLNQIQRSSSTRDFRKLDQRKLKLPAMEG
ncbi:Cyclin-dependent kinase [Bertholletia excelsa]